jgi:hypothetical protein
VTKVNGLGDQLYVAGYNLSGDIGSVGKIGGGPAALEVTAIDKLATERIGGARDGGIDFTAYFNPSANAGHARLSALPYGDAIVTYHRGQAVGAPGAACIARQTNYDGKRGNDGAMTFDVSASADGYGLEWGVQGTAGIRTDTTATNGASFDRGASLASTAFGLQAYLHVFAFTGTSCTVKIQDSADNSTFADLTGAAFTAASGITSQRIATSLTQTVRRYLRVATTGTFTSCQFAVIMVPNDIATVI